MVDGRLTLHPKLKRFGSTSIPTLIHKGNVIVGSSSVFNYVNQNFGPHIDIIP